jgi:MOSC domain-containing protein YiiM
MSRDTILLDSDSVGDPVRFRSVAELESALRELPPSPTDVGRCALIVSRREGGRRETPEQVRLTFAGGVAGDAWARRDDPRPEAQITVMERSVAALIANGQPLTLFGDNLFLDLDLSSSNLPTGTRLRLGTALLEVTPKPHNGCKKFLSRFGEEALRFVGKPETRHRNFRGIYVRVIEDGDAGPGDLVEVLERGA